MSELVVTNTPRPLSGFGGDPAALLLRSARADAVPAGAKDRVRARLGIAESIVESNSVPSVSPTPQTLPTHTSSKRSKRTRKIAPLIPFQHLISTPKPWAMRKAGAAAVVFVQVAAMVAALFIRPFPKFETVPELASENRDEPELVFFAQSKTHKESKHAAIRLPAAAPKGNSGRGSAGLFRPASLREPSLLKESIVADEHAGALSERIDPSILANAAETSLSVESASRADMDVSSPMVFQSGMTQPIRTSGVDPAYPMRARMRGITGTVVMRCVVTATGLAKNCMILKSPAYLDEAVLTAAQSWRFTPIVWQGRPVSVNYVFKYKFQLG